jgi:BtpA family
MGWRRLLLPEQYVYTGARLADEAYCRASHRRLQDVGVHSVHRPGSGRCCGKAFPSARDRSLRDEVENTVDCGPTEAVIISGTSTGKPTALADVRTVKGHAGSEAVYVGSGVDESAIEALLEVADGAILGTAFKLGYEVSAPVDRTRVSDVSQSYGGSLLARGQEQINSLSRRTRCRSI